MLTMSDESTDEDGGSNEKIVLDIIKRFCEITPEPLKRTEASKTVKERGNDGMISI